MQFVVYQNFRDYGDVFRTEIASFDTESEAEEFREEQERHLPFRDIFYTIEQE